MMSPLDAALYLVSRGGRVFPLHGVRPGPHGRLVCTCGQSGCDQAGKHPLARLAPRGLKNATSDAAVVRRWFTAEPSANIGLVAGRAVVLDVDPRHGGDDTLRALEDQHGPLPMTVRAITGGGGEHVFLRPPPGVEIRNSAGVLGAGLDVRGAGGYVVAPPSLHVSGRAYEWSVDHHPDEVAVAAMPAWMVAALTQPAEATPRAPSDWRRLVAEGVPNGCRNESVSRLTGHLLRRFVDAEVAHELVQAWNMARCQPPLTPEEVTKIVGSIARKELSRREARNGHAR